MSAGVTRAKKLKHGTTELTQPAETGVPGKLEVRPVIEVTRVTGADRGSISDHGMTPLMSAASDGLAGTVQALLDRGAEVNAKRSDGFNALALAAFFGHSQVVWLLLENGADLAATGRSETPPEMWADIRGFVDIGDTLREARATKQVEASSPRIAVIDEPARFSRPAEKEKLVIRQPLPVSKTLPEIKDPPPLVVPEFHPGSIFVARITASWKNLVALILAVLLVCGGIAAFLFPQIRKSLADLQTKAVTETPNLPTEPSNPVAGSGTNGSGTVETPSAATTESTTAPASRDVEETTTDTTADSKPVESTSRVESAEASANKREFSVVTPTWRPVAPARKQRAVSRAVKFKQQIVVAEQPKPAPLTVEMSRSSSVLSTPARSVSEVPGSQPPPLSIISDKPKSKVIQWP